MFWYEKVDKNKKPTREELKNQFWIFFPIFVITSLSGVLLAFACMNLEMFAIAIMFAALIYFNMMNQTKITYINLYGKKRRR